MTESLGHGKMASASRGATSSSTASNSITEMMASSSLRQPPTSRRETSRLTARTVCPSPAGAAPAETTRSRMPSSTTAWSDVASRGRYARHATWPTCSGEI